MSLWDILVPAEPGVVHNTIANPSFEYNNVNVYSQQTSTTNGTTNGIKYWNAVNSATISRSNTWASQGTYSLKIAAGATTSSGVEYNPRLSANTTTYTISLSNDTTYTSNIPAAKSVTIAVMALDDVGISLANGISDVQNYHFTTNSSEKNSYAYPTIDAKRGHTAPIYSTPITTVLNQSIKIVITDSPTSTVDTAPRGWAVWYTYTDTSPVPDEKMYILATIIPNNNIAETTTVYLRSIILPQKMTLYTNAGNPSYITSDFTTPSRIFGTNTVFTTNDIGKSIYILSENNQYQFVGKIVNRSSATYIALDTNAQQKNIAYSQFYITSETVPQSFDNNSYGGVSSFVYNTATLTYINSAIGLNSTAPYFGITNSAFGGFTKKHHLYLDWYLSSPNTTNPNASYTDTGAQWAVYLVNNTTSASTLLGTLDASTAVSTYAKRMGLRKKFFITRPSGDTSNMAIKIINTGATTDADLYIDGVQFIDVGMIWRSYDWYNTTASTYNTPLHFDDWDWDAVEFSYVDGDVPGAIWSDTMPTQSGTYTASFPYFTENGVWHGNPSEYNVSENANGYASPQFRQQFQWKNEAKPVYGVSLPGLSQSSLLIQSTTTGFWAPLTTNNINVVVEPNSTGVGMPEIATTALEYGIIDGGFIQRQVSRMRNIQFTVTISAQSWTGLHANRRSLINLLKFDQLAQQGDRMIRYTGAGTIITTSVTYQGGLEYGGTSQNASFTELLQIRFLSADPYFYALTSLSQNLQINPYSTNDSSHVLYKLGNSSEWLPLSRHYFNNNNSNYTVGETLFYDKNNNVVPPQTIGWITSPSGNVSTLVAAGGFVRPFKNIAFFYVSGFTENNSDTYITNSIYSRILFPNTVTASTTYPILTANSASVFYQKPIEGFLVFGGDGSAMLGIVASFTKTSLGANSFSIDTTNNLVKIVTIGSNPFVAGHIGKGLWTAGGVFIGIIATITTNTTPVGATAATLLANSEVTTGSYQMAVGGGTMSNGSNSRVILTTNALNVWSTSATIIQPSKTLLNLSPSNVYGKQLFQLSDDSVIYTLYQDSPNSLIAVGDFTSIIESGITNPSTSSDTTYGIVETTQLGYTNHVYSRAMRFTMNDSGRITAQPIDYPSENLTLSAGTISITSGSTSVTGLNTNFVQQDVGLHLYYYDIYNNNAKTFIGVIATVASSTSITLKIAYSGSTIASQQFYITGKSNLYNLLNYTSNYDFSIKNTIITAVTASAYNAYFFAIHSTTQQSGNQYDNFYPNQLTRSLSAFAKENLNSSVVYLDSVGNTGFVGIRLCSRAIGTISYNSSTSTNLLITGSSTSFDYRWNGKSVFTSNGLYIGQIYAVLTTTTLLLCEPPPFLFTDIEFEVSHDAFAIIVDNKTQKNTIYVSLLDAAVEASAWKTFMWAFVNNPTPITQVSTVIGSRSIGAYPQFFDALGINNIGTIINAKTDSPNLLGADTKFISSMTNNYLITNNIIIGQIKSVIDSNNIVLFDNSKISNNVSGKVTVTLASANVVGIFTSFTAADVGKKLYTFNKIYVGIIASYTSATSVTLAANALYAMSAEEFYLGVSFVIRPYKYITDSVGYQSLGGIILSGNDSVINTNFSITKQIGTISNNTISPSQGSLANGQPIGQAFFSNSSFLLKGEFVNPFVFTDTTQNNVFVQSGTSLIGQILRRSVGRLYANSNSTSTEKTPFESAINGVGNISSGAINANLIQGEGTLDATAISDTSVVITATSTYFQTTDIGRSLYTKNYEFIGVIIACGSITSVTVSNVQVSISAGTAYYFSGISVLSSGANTLTSVSAGSTSIGASGGFLSTDVGRLLFTNQGQYIGTIDSYSSATAVTLVNNPLFVPPTPSTFGISTPLYMYQFSLYANASSNAFFAKSDFGIQTIASYAIGTTTAISVNYCPYGTMSGSYAAYAYVNSMWFFLGDITAFASTPAITIGGGTVFAIDANNPIAIIPYVTIDTSSSVSISGGVDYKVGCELYGNDLYGNAGLSYVLGTGVITATTASSTVTGVGTIFSNLDINKLLYNSAGTLIGTIIYAISSTNISLSANALVNVTSGTFNISNSSTEGYIGTVAKIKSTYTSGTGTISVALGGTAVTAATGTPFVATDIGRVLYNSSGTVIGAIGAFISATSVTLVSGALVAVSPAAAFNISNNQITLTYMPYYAYNSAFVPTSWKSPSKNITPIVSATNLNSLVYILAKEFEGSQSSNFFADTIGYVDSISGTVGNQYTIAKLNSTPSVITPSINQSLFSGTQRFTTSTSSSSVTIATIAGAANITTAINNGSVTLAVDANASLLAGRSIYTSAGVYIGTVKYATSTTNAILDAGATVAYGAAAYLVTANSIKFGIYAGDVLRHVDGRLIGQVKSVDIVNLKLQLTGNALVSISGAPVLIQRGYILGQGIGKLLSSTYSSASAVTTLTGLSVGSSNVTNFTTLPLQYATTVFGSTTITVNSGSDLVTAGANVFSGADIGKYLYYVLNSVVISFIGVINQYISPTQMYILNPYTGTALTTVSYALGNGTGDYGYTKIRMFAEYQGNIYYLGFTSALSVASSSSITIETNDGYNPAYNQNLPINNNGYNWYYLMEFDYAYSGSYYSMYQDNNISVIGGSFVTPTIPWASGIGNISKVSYDGTTNVGFGQDSVSIVTGNTGVGGANIATRFENQVYAGNIVNIYSGAASSVLSASNYIFGMGSANILATGTNAFNSTHVGQHLYDISNNEIGTILSITANTAAGSIAATLDSNALVSGTSFIQIGAVNLLYQNSYINVTIAPGGSNPFNANHVGFTVYNSANAEIGKIDTVTANTTAGQIAATIFGGSSTDPSPITYSAISANNFTFNQATNSILIVTAGSNPFSGTLYVGQNIYSSINIFIGVITSTTTNTGAGQLAATFTANASVSGAAYTQISANAFVYSNTSANLVIRVAGNPFTNDMVGMPVHTTAGLSIGTIASVNTANTAVNTVAAVLTTNSSIDGTVFAQISANSFQYNTANILIKIVTVGSNPFTSAHIGQKLYNAAGALIGEIATVTTNTTPIGATAATLTANSLLSASAIVGFKGTTVATTTGTLRVGSGGVYITGGTLAVGLGSANTLVASGVVTKVTSNSSMTVKFNYWDKINSANFLTGTYYWNYVAAPTETVIKTNGNTAFVNNDWQSLGQQNGFIYALTSLKNGDIFVGGSFTGWSDKSKSSSIGTPSAYRSVYRIAKLVINATPNVIAESYASPIVGTSYTNNGLGSDVYAIVDVSDINPINGYVGSGDRIMIGGNFTQTMNGENLLPALGFVEGNTMSNSMRPVVNADVEPLTLNGVTPIAYSIATTNRLRHYSNPITSNILDGINGSNAAVMFNEPVIANTKMQFTSVRIRGNASVYPIITIANTTSNVLDLISLIQTETGARILFNNSKLNIYPNEIITIDLRIGKRSVTSNTRFNLISYIHPLSNFVDWILIGANSAAGNATQSTDDYHINVIGIHADYGLNASISYTPRFWSFDANNLFYGTTKAGL